MNGYFSVLQNIYSLNIRVCAKLVEDQDTCEELRYPKDGQEVSFWEITGQQQWNWKDKICGGPNPGTNW